MQKKAKHGKSLKFRQTQNNSANRKCRILTVRSNGVCNKNKKF